MNFFAWIGRHCINLIFYIIDLACFLTQTISVWQPHRNVFNRAVYLVVLEQIILIGINSIAIISLLAMFVGFGVTSQLIYIMQSLTGNNDLVEIIARLVLSEIGPLITGFLLVGRSCSAIVVDLGNTRVGGEVEPLEYMGINVDDYFVIPRILSMVISQTVLAFYFLAVMIVCGVFFSALLYDFSVQQSLMELLNMISLNEVIRFTLKNLFFGSIIGTIACFHGLLVDSSSISVADQMQKAVVRCLMFLFMADAYFIIFTL
ncbi:MAG: ABC transporter permease [Methylococcales symbiont of Iophon sp. n. MRB-2018]|nr:MAG: ABC transporter permease [Methylococcales symbiont of Iophon sp. n. MRB-2018]KAF3980342.1 MAG: ABC transporter permease [Methylococcales symbiont of Iophon sp. n. MRB-2018]